MFGQIYKEFFVKITFNSPVVLSFAAISLGVLFLSFLTKGAIDQYFTYNSANLLTLGLYPLGHVSFDHFAGNMMFLILLGPALEEKYGSTPLFLMILFTAIVTAIVNGVIFNTGIIGASGIVFMMIVLSSFTNAKEKELPGTSILIIALYLGRELFDGMSPSNVSHFGHILGGICGGVFGIFNLKTQNKA